MQRRLVIVTIGLTRDFSNLFKEKLMKIAVTGANGLVGRHLCIYLISKGISVVSITRKACNIEGASNLILADFSDIEKASGLIDGCIAIVHLAALTHSATATYSDYSKVNVELSRAMAKAAAKAGIQTFIYLSSIKVNGEYTIDKPFRHTDPPTPQDHYGRSKLRAEQALSQDCLNSNIDLIIIRPPLILDRHSQGNIQMLSNAISWHLPLPLANSGNRRDIVSLHNLSSLIYQCLLTPGLSNETLLVSDGAAMSTTEIVKSLANNGGKRVLLFRMPTFMRAIMSKTPKLKYLYQRLFGNLEVDINHTLNTVRWQPKAQTPSNLYE